MQARIAKWGNSLGLRIPKDITTQLGLAEGAEVQIEIEGDRVVISPRRPHYKLSDLLGGMTPKSMRDAFNWGPDASRESID